MFCAIRKRRLLLRGCCTLLVRCRCWNWRSFLPGGLCGAGGPGGEQSTLSCWWDCAESHGPDPGLAGHKETLQAVGDTRSPVTTEPKPETSLLPPHHHHSPPAISLMGFSAWVGEPRACAAVFWVFPGSEPRRSCLSCNPGSSPPGWYPK